MNEPLPGQMTVGDLRNLLKDVPDEVVLAFAAPPGGVGHPELATLVNVRAEKRGPLFVISPHDGDLDQPHPQRDLGAGSTPHTDE